MRRNGSRYTLKLLDFARLSKEMAGSSSMCHPAVHAWHESSGCEDQQQHVPLHDGLRSCVADAARGLSVCCLIEARSPTSYLSVRCKLHNNPGRCRCTQKWRRTGDPTRSCIVPPHLSSQRNAHLLYWRLPVAASYVVEECRGGESSYRLGARLKPPQRAAALPLLRPAAPRAWGLRQAAIAFPVLPSLLNGHSTPEGASTRHFMTP